MIEYKSANTNATRSVYNTAAATDWLDHWAGNGRHYGWHKLGMPIIGREAREAMVGKMNEEVFDSLNIPSAPGVSVNVLDAGGGVGIVAIELAQRYPNTTVWSITLSPDEIPIGEQLIKSHSLVNRVFIQCMDYRRTDYGDDFFDRVFFMESLCHDDSPCKRETLSELARITRSNGRVVVADAFQTHAGALKPGVNHLYTNLWQPGWGKPTLVYIGDFKQALVDAGFTDIKIRNISFHVIPTAIHGMVMGAQYYISHRIHGTWENLDKNKQGHAISAFTTGILGASGDFGYYIVSAAKS